MGPYEYSARVWNEIEKEEEECHGVTFGTSYADAVKKLENYYGDTLIEFTIFANEECSVYEFESTQEDFSHGKYKIEFEEW